MLIAKTLLIQGLRYLHVNIISFWENILMLIGFLDVGFVLTRIHVVIVFWGFFLLVQKIKCPPDIAINLK